jgi:hypothetical protein
MFWSVQLMLFIVFLNAQHEHFLKHKAEQRRAMGKVFRWGFQRIES